MPRLVVTDHNFPDLEHERAAARAAGAELLACSAPEEIPAALDGAEVALVQFARVGDDLLARMAPGATLVRYGVGFDNIDVAAARARGLRVAYVPDYCADEVADHTVALLLAALRKVVRLDATTRAGQWSPVAQAAPILPFRETAVGFLGLGRIGGAVLERLRPFGFRFLVHDPFLGEERARGLGLEPVEREGLAARSDALTLHAPLTPATRHAVDARFLAAMRPHAVLVNTSRGELIDTLALAEALVAGRLAAAALDVFEGEPLAADHPLRQAPGAILSPHAAWYSTASIGRLQRLAAEEALRALRGEPLRCPVPAG